jgi:2,3-bisphosphoglycerate-independent phosphoglycerate mutase
LGARAVVPAGATGGVDTSLEAKAHAAREAIERGAARVVVHVGAPDEAAHLRDAAAKVAAIERADRELVAPLMEAVRRAGGTLRVCPDHGCDPRTGEHDGAPVPCLDWPARAEVPTRDGGAPMRASGAALRRAPGADQARLMERAVAGLPVVELAAREAVAA